MKPADTPGTARFPERVSFAGKSVVLEPISPSHVDDLWAAAHGADASWQYLRYGPFPSRGAMAALVLELESRAHQPFWAIKLQVTGKAQGWVSLCDIYPDDAAIEIGSVWFSPALQRTRAGSEAIFMLMRHAFDDLGYQRLVWRCLADNMASLQAAKRYGFRPEGLWRSAVSVKGRRFDVAWHALLANEWPAQKEAFIKWLHDANFASDGTALARMETLRSLTG